MPILAILAMLPIITSLLITIGGSIRISIETPLIRTTQASCLTLSILAAIRKGMLINKEGSSLKINCLSFPLIIRLRIWVREALIK